MVNSLGLDVHGSSEDQDQGPPSDTTQSTASPHIQPEVAELSWGILASSTQQDTEASWGILASTAQSDTVDSWGVVEEPQKDTIESWGTAEEPQKDTIESWGKVEEPQKDNVESWGTVEEPQKDNVESWGTVEEPQKVGKSKGTVDSWDAPQKNDRSKGTENSRGTPEDLSADHKDDKSKKDKGVPYVPAAPPTRAKMTPEELASRMEKIRLQNEKIKERREYVKADEEAFNTSVAADRARQAANRKIQAQINQSREQNAKRKLDKMGIREWDSGKHSGEWKQGIRGRGKSSAGTSKDEERRWSTAKSRNDVDVSAANEVGAPLSDEGASPVAPQNTIDPSHSRFASQDNNKN